MRNKWFRLVTGVIFFGCVIFILGQAGLSDCDQIGIGSCIVKIAVALAILIIDSLVMKLKRNGGN